MRTVRLSIAIRSHENDAQIEMQIDELKPQAEKRLRFVKKVKELYGTENLHTEVSVKTLDHIWETFEKNTTFVLEYWWHYGDNEKEFDEATIRANSLEEAIIQCRKMDRRIFAIYHNRIKVL